MVKELLGPKRPEYVDPPKPMHLLLTMSKLCLDQSFINSPTQCHCNYLSNSVFNRAVIFVSDISQPICFSC